MEKVHQNDLSIIYYTANIISDYFARSTRHYLQRATHGYPLISVSLKPMSLGHNIVVDYPRHHLSIYKQALLGAKAATTKYIALCEDDVLYSSEHFKQRPSPGKFAYNLGTWNLFTWGDPIFTHKGSGRINLCNLICERELFIEAMEERFIKYPTHEGVNLSVWAEPGKYERQLGVTVRDIETFYTNPPNIMFSHPTALSYDNLGQRKRLGEFRADRIPFWGEAREIRKLYDVRS